MTSFAVRCNEGFNGGLPQSFMLEVRESHTQEMRANMTSPVARFNVTNGLEPGAHYQAAVYAYNPKGKAEPVILQAATLRLPEKQLTSEKGIVLYNIYYFIFLKLQCVTQIVWQIIILLFIIILFDNLGVFNIQF